MTGCGLLPLRALALALALSVLGTGAAVRLAHSDGPPRIVNGVLTQNRPTTGALLVSVDRLLGGVCSGTLVGCRHFVTAAHCVCAGSTAATCGTPDPARFRVYLQHAGVLGVRSVSVHPSFSFGTLGDVAVLQLSTPVTGIRPTPLNSIGTPRLGLAGTIAGFGITGAVNDFGLLREGGVTLSSCGTVVPEPAHLCWTFDELIGPPGTDSNACSGDSGGSLLVSLGGQGVLGGVTSGGISPDCLPRDVSFASNVFQNRTFIEAVAGTDASSTSCGSISQVGDAGTHATGVLFTGLSKDELACRKFIARGYSSYTAAKLRLLRRCVDGVNGGTIAGPCPDTATGARITRAADSVRSLAETSRSKCTPEVVAAIGTTGACAGARDANDLQRCILSAGDSTVGELVDAVYADANPTTAITDLGLRACQAAISKTMGRYSIARLRLLARCQVSADTGKVRSCPDAATQKKIAGKAAKVFAAIAANCTDEQVTTLNLRATFGGSCATARSTVTLAGCETTEHDTETDGLLRLFDGTAARRLTSVSVPPGTTRLRVTLNGIDAGANELNLYAKRGAAPSTTVFDARSANTGVYEGLDVVAPGAGPWFILVNQVGGGVVPFQLTITAFGP